MVGQLTKAEKWHHVVRQAHHTELAEVRHLVFSNKRRCFFVGQNKETVEIHMYCRGTQAIQKEGDGYEVWDLGSGESTEVALLLDRWDSRLILGGFIRCPITEVDIYIYPAHNGRVVTVCELCQTEGNCNVNI